MKGNDLMFLGRCSVAAIAAASILSVDAIQPVQPQFIEQVASYKDDDGSHCAVLRAIAGWSSIMTIRTREGTQEPRFSSSNEANARGESRQPLLRNPSYGGWVAQPNLMTWHPVPSPDTRLYETYIHACADDGNQASMRDVIGAGGDATMDIDLVRATISASLHGTGMVPPEGWERGRARYGEKRTFALQREGRALACERWTVAASRGLHRVEVKPSGVSAPLSWIEVVESERGEPPTLAHWSASQGHDNVAAPVALSFTLTEAGRADVLVCFSSADSTSAVLYALRVE